MANVMKRKVRCGFNIKKDIMLLRSALQYNPWQLGEQQWEYVGHDMESFFGTKITKRTMKGRMNLLVEKYTKQQLKVPTGTEEEVTERGELIEKVDAIIQEEAASINRTLGADDDEEYENADEINTEFVEGIDVDVVEGIDVDVVEGIDAEVVEGGDVDVIERIDGEVVEEITNDTQPKTLGSKRISKGVQKKRRQEKIQADLDRQHYVDEADEPDRKSTRSSRVSLEDKLIQSRHEHECEMEKERMEIEKLRENRFAEEGRRRDEMAAAQLEIQKEEGRRRDEMAAAQLEIQKTMLNLMQHLMPN